MNPAKAQFETIDQYIKTFPKEVQVILEKVRQTIHRVIPEADEAISYQIPTFKIDGKYVVYFAGYAHHMSLYPIPKGDAALQQEIAPHKAGKGTLQFSLGQPIPYELVKKVATALLEERRSA